LGVIFVVGVCLCVGAGVGAVLDVSPCFFFNPLMCVVHVRVQYPM
jgi:hypothetical protein